MKMDVEENVDAMKLEEETEEPMQEADKTGLMHS